jgi:hypothetical protein
MIVPASDRIDAVALVVLARTPVVLRALIDDVPLAALTTALDEGWSVKDVFAHLVDTEGGVIVARLKRILGEERPFIQSIDPPARLAAGGYAGRSIESLLEELARQREADLGWLRARRRRS